MRSTVLAIAFALAAPAWADRAYVVDREQSLTSIDLRGLSAVSRALNGQVRESGSGALRIEARMPLSSFVSDGRLPAGTDGAQEIAFEGSSEGGKPKDGLIHIVGRLTMNGVTRPIEVWMTLAHVGSSAFGHAYFLVHLREFGLPLPRVSTDEARVQIDAALRQDTRLAER
jgi:YceI-like domain